MEPIYIQKWLPYRKALLQIGISRDKGWYDKTENKTKNHHYFSFCRMDFNENEHKGYRLVIGPLSVMVGW